LGGDIATDNIKKITEETLASKYKFKVKIKINDAIIMEKKTP
tara:strand:+ start:365 stop:490 length:126 start_codon:yes stop_codon:yes gene_type:complete